MKKGQYIRLFMDDKVFAASTSCTLHIGAHVEDSSTKDTDEGGWADNEVTGLSWDATVEALVIVPDAQDGGNQLDDVLDAFADDEETYTFQLCQTTGTKNRTEDGVLAQGACRVSEVSISAPNRQNSTYSVSLIGTGALGTGSTTTTTTNNG